MRFQPLEKLINLYDGYRRAFRIDQLHLLLIQQGQDLFLVDSRCPHRGFSLLEATLDDHTLRCPSHGYRFDIRSGQLQYQSEESCAGLRCYELIYRDNEVGLMLD